MLTTFYDYRLGNIPAPYVAEKEKDMQIPDEVRKCVVFIAYENSIKEKKLIGTAFFVVMESKDQSCRFTYLITARHNIAKIVEEKRSSDGLIYIRINKKAGGFEFIPVAIESFIPHPDPIDVTVLNWTPDATIYDYMHIPYHMILDAKIISEKSIGIGDEIFMTGLFSNHYGTNKNIPIVRVGNISAMPDEPIKTRKFGEIEAYLIELRSLGGLSGSPVFVHLSHARVTSDGLRLGTGQNLFYLLGLLHGHWDLESATQDVILEDSYPDKSKINTGIGIAVPAIKILETLDHPIFADLRKKKIEEIEKARLPIEDNSFLLD